jgi:hypothetical protein
MVGVTSESKAFRLEVSCMGHWGLRLTRPQSLCGARRRRGVMQHDLVPRACDPLEGTRGSGIIRCRKPGILAKIELRIPFQRPIRFLPETDYPRA